MDLFIADFHIHSRFSRATSSSINIESLSREAERKGISLLGTGDFTHPGWLAELKENLIPRGDGLFEHKGILFVLTVEVSNDFYRGGKSKRIHNLIFAPSFEAVERINRVLSQFGGLEKDGRPSLNLPAGDMVRLILEVSPQSLIVPAHVWTPWFSLFGANSGFDSVEECFGEQTPNIYALETGLSSDPPMNWRLQSLDRYTLISNSDAHSPTRIGREANVFSHTLDYAGVIKAIKERDLGKLLYTIEFFPQEGKYHWDGHRKCGISLSPQEAISNYSLCPICGRKLTIGVMHRVEELADRPEGFRPPGAIPCKHLVPLVEIISQVLEKGRGTLTVKSLYERMTDFIGPEFEILLDKGREEITQVAPPQVADAIFKVREGEVEITPGYDGVYGQVRIKAEEKPPSQMELF
jgi:uncharacterized protein (TIGR00375 family)